ncbi:unnamed protein product [Acanthoscelides obtectus]|uniref:EF-hand domain-containing protein n=1 Tax=Acanthoscelides obtectus TaxID=200917 RepID=A0A9P0JNC2_ACAOB|nr:unnamed protein product [Acanthoscelides obtectus]CAK1661805.1 Multiple coagulation factor deficiency protein 2 homolog [Acanthoscelides obtectus]
MYIAVILSFLTVVSTFVHAKGPHHPRGGKVVKRHVHYRPTKSSPKINEDAQLLHDKDHIQEHLEEVIPKPDLSKMTDEELEFYYFQLHDTDKNSKLDGLEILHAIYHTDDEEHEENQHEENNTDSMAVIEHYIALIDEVLQEDDVDQDGYLTYSEFIAGKRSKNRRSGKASTSTSTAT